MSSASSQIPNPKSPAPCLVIGYGNGLRGDDAIGIVIAEAVAAWNLPHVKVIACHQLTPELSEDISEAALVIFADAAATGSPGDVTLTAVEPADPTTSSAHAGDPARLLGLAQVVFGKCPPAWTITVAAEDMDFREGLTETAQRGVNEALARVRGLVG